MMMKRLIHLHQHMEMNPLVIIVIWYQLLCFSTQIRFKVCWWITQLHIWVDLMIIWMLHQVPKQWGEMVLLTFFCTLPNVSLSNFLTVKIIAEASLKSLYSKLDFKVINHFTTSINFEKARKWFHYESGNPNHCRNEQLD